MSDPLDYERPTDAPPERPWGDPIAGGMMAIAAGLIFLAGAVAVGLGAASQSQARGRSAQLAGYLLLWFAASVLLLGIIRWWGHRPSGPSGG